MKDLLSGDFSETVNLTFLKKIRLLAQAALSLSLIYAALEIINWSIVINSSINKVPGTFRAFYQYRIQPVIFLVLITLGIFGWIFNVKAATLLIDAFEHKDTEALNKGFSFTYRTGILAITAFCISIISAAIRLFTYY